MVKKLCDICGKGQSCNASVNVIKKKEIDNFDSISESFCNSHRDFFQNESFGTKPLRSVDSLAYDDAKTKVSLIEIKKASAGAISTYLNEIKEKFIDSLFVLSHLNPEISVKGLTIATPDNNSIELNRVRLSLSSFFSRTQKIDENYYFTERSHLFSHKGLLKRFCYPALFPTLKQCKDAV